MKSDFKKMEDEMDCLSSNMQQIQVVSDSINRSLDGHRQELSKLAGVHSLLKKVNCVCCPLLLFCTHAIPALQAGETP